MKITRILFSTMLLVVILSQACLSETGPGRKCEESCRPSPEVKSSLARYNVTAPLDKLTNKTVPLLRQTEKVIAATTVDTISMNRIVHLSIEAGDHTIPIAVYIPRKKESSPDNKMPVMIFIHGGGWTLTNTAFYDPVIRKLADAVQAVVVSPDYRLAPEDPFPAAVDDCFATLQWVARNVSEFGADPSKIILSGDSGGGNLATVTALRAKEQGGPQISFQALFYPSVNIADIDTRSAKCFGRKFMLTTKAIKSFRSFYLPKENDWKNPLASPLQAQDLKGMPPALVITAGCDPLLDEGSAYAQKLSEAGTKVIYHMEPNIFHGYLNSLNRDPLISPIAEKTLDYAARIIRENL